VGTTAKTNNFGIEVGDTLLGKYQVLSVLGQGGMGIVVKARHMGLDEEVAIKCLRPDVMLDPEAVSRFVREAQAAVKLKSEHVARVSDVGTFDGGKPYMVMEYLDGQDLETFATAGTASGINPQLAIELIIQAAEALAEAHSLGIVHRDIKPTNLFITWRPDGSPLLKVLDFGISKSPIGTDMALTQTQSILGTPAYMSPEQMRSARKVDPRTDIWSLATVLYEVLEGHRPFEAESFSEMCVKVAMDPPTPMVTAPPQLADILYRALAKSPDQRFATVAELARALAPFSRDPQQSLRSVERMNRMLNRRMVSWDGDSIDGSSRSSMLIASAADFSASTDRTPNPLSTAVGVPSGSTDQRESRSSFPAPHAAPPTILSADLGSIESAPVSKRKRWVLPAVLGAVGCAAAVVLVMRSGTSPSSTTPTAAGQPTVTQKIDPIKQAALTPDAVPALAPVTPTDAHTAADAHVVGATIPTQDAKPPDVETVLPVVQAGKRPKVATTRPKRPLSGEKDVKVIVPDVGKSKPVKCDPFKSSAGCP
jgi:eukaryotic-like serine/threonine-protein kinase